MTRGSYPSGAYSPGPQERGVPWLTWLIAVAALVVLGAAAVVFNEKPPQATEGPVETGDSNASPAEPQTTDPAVRPPEPLDLSPLLLDAQERAKIWRPKAALGTIEAEIAGGKQLSSVTFEFGTVENQGVTGGNLSPERLTLTYRDGRPEEETTVDKKTRISIPEPNCPLESALLSTRKGRGLPSGNLLARYVQSTDHGKPLWILTASSGEVSYLDADSCAIVVH